MLECFFEYQFKHALIQIHRGLALRCKGHQISSDGQSIIVVEKSVVHIDQSRSGRHLIIELVDIDPETFIWEDYPQYVWTVDLFQDLDLNEEIEVIADHVISHLNRFLVPVADDLLDDPAPDPALMEYLGIKAVA